jgi:hypothetical protein
MSQYGNELSTTYQDMEEDHHAEWMDIDDEEYNDDNIFVCVATLLLVRKHVIFFL